MKYYLLYGGACTLGLVGYGVMGAAVCAAIVAVMHGFVLACVEGACDE